MSVLGLNNMLQFILPTGWDASQLAQFMFADGFTYEQIVGDVAMALVEQGNQLLSDPILGGLFSTTPEIALEYRNGSAGTGMTLRTEHAEADTKRAATIGHMLPLKSYDRKLGWTWDFLRKVRSVQVTSDIADAMYDVRDSFQRGLLTRFFTTTENQLGASGYDVPFVKGGGSVAFTPPAYDGQSFTSSHTHFDRQAANGQATALKAGAKHLFEHGIKGPYSAIIPQVDVATYSALTGYIHPQRGIQYIRTDSAANFGAMPVDDRLTGAFETDFGLIYLWNTPRLPTNYLGLYKSWGLNDPRNPLAVRYDPKLGVGPILLRGAAFQEYPLEKATILHEYGVGVKDRLNGYACYFAAGGNYTDPTIA